MARSTEQLARLHAIADDANHPLQRTALAALRKLASAQKRGREERAALSSGPVRRYQVNGVWKLTERIADHDPEGDAVNGASDRVRPTHTGRTLRPTSDYQAPALLPEQKLTEKDGMAGVRRNAAAGYRAHGVVR